MFDEKIVLVGVAINFLASISYIIDTLKGKARPNRATWFIWTIAPMLAFAGELSKHVGIRSLVTFIAGFVPLLILIASFFNKKSTWKLETFDYYCGGLSLLGLVFWLITGEGNLAIAFAILADFLAALPTLKKSFLYPETENYIAFIGGAVSALTGVLVVDDWSLANVGFPLYALIVCITLVLLIRFRIGVKVNNFLGEREQV